VELKAGTGQDALRAMRDAFRAKLKEEWGNLWRERFDDRVRAEGVSVKEYPFLFIDRGRVIFASRDAKTASFSDAIEYWSSQGFIYSPDPAVGGWGKFIRTELIKQAHSRAREFNDDQAKKDRGDRQLKKGGRGWLHACRNLSSSS
jgi:hypothetical protein